MAIIETENRRIVSEIPHPDTVEVIQGLRAIEPRSMGGMAPVFWGRARGCHVFDGCGNMWLDFTSAVVLANAGHANPKISAAIKAQLDAELWHSYGYPCQIRLDAVKAVLDIAPRHLDKVFLLTTGSEAVECAIKLARLHGRRIRPGKIGILSFTNSFHGRTMGSQTAGGCFDQHEWMGDPPTGFHHIPFPECARCPWGRAEYGNCGEECLQRGLASLAEHGADPDCIAAVITETFQGPMVAFMPDDYVQALRRWASEHSALLVFDEMQAGFGRTGRWFGCEHYPVEADLICMGKGMTSSLPMSAVLGRGAILDLAAHGGMSSTHTGNPLCCAATLANIEAIRANGLVENAARLGPVVREALESLRDEFPDRVGAIHGKGLAWAVYLVKPGTRELDVDLGSRTTDDCMRHGLLMLQTHRGTLKLAPPLCISRDAILEGIGVIREALRRC